MEMIEYLTQLESLAEEQPKGTIPFLPNSDPEEDAEKMRAAVKGIGTDENALIEIVSSRRNKQRQEIKNSYKSFFGRTVKEDLCSDLSGNFQKLMLALFEPPLGYEAKCIHGAIKGVGTDDSVLIEVLCSRNNREIRALRSVYKKKYDVELEADLESDTSGDFRRLLITLCNADRDENEEVDLRKAVTDATSLFNAGEGLCGTDEEVFNKVLCKRSYPQLRATFSEYFRLAGKDISTAIEDELSGDIKRAFLAIVQVARCRPAFYAIRLYESMKGLGTDDSAVVRILASRSENDMVQIKKAFNLMYNSSLSDFIESDTSGDYKRLCISLL